MKNFNNKKITEQDFNSAQQQFAKVNIDEDKKNEMLQSIYSSIDAVENRSPIPSPYNPYLILFQKRSVVFALAAIIILTGTTYASEKSLPGEPLYVVKTKVLEPINYNLRISKESKEAYKEIITKKRSLEAQMLIEKDLADSDPTIAETDNEDDVKVNVSSTTTKPTNEATSSTILKTKIDPNVSGVLNIDINATSSTIVDNDKEKILNVDVNVDTDNDNLPKVEARVEVKVEPEKVVDKVTDTVDKATNILGL